MNKYAAEKIASEYYNMGVQLALQNAGLVKTASNPLAKALGVGAAGTGAALSPAALTALTKGVHGGTTGAHQLAALKSLMGGEFAHAANIAKTIPGAAKRDAAELYQSMLDKVDRFRGMPTAAEMKELEALSESLPSVGL